MCSRAYLTLNKIGCLKDSIKECNRRLPNQNTWINFNTYFCQAHNKYRETTNLTLEQARMEQRNANSCSRLCKKSRVLDLNQHCYQSTQMN